MTTYELYELLAANRELIADTWNLYLGVHIAIVASFLVRPRSAVGSVGWRLLLGVPLYVVFSYLNYRAQVDNYKYSDAIMTALSQVEGQELVAGAMITRVFEEVWILDYLMLVYVLSGVCVIGLLLGELLPVRRRTPKRAAKTAAT